MKQYLLLLAGLMILAPYSQADAKAVKLGRGNAYSVAADARLNTGAGSAKVDTEKKCDSSCSSCDTTTGKCIGCPSGKRPDGSRCVDSCYNVVCKSGYTTVNTAEGCCCKADTPTCSAGYYLKKSGSDCEKCPTGCSLCSDSSMGVYCTACSSGYTMGSNSYGLGTCNKTSCPAGQYFNSGSNNCVACSSGTYSSGGTATSCSSCNNLFVGSNGSMKFTCLSCSTTGTCLTCGYNGSSSGYKMSNGRCEFIGSNSGSGAGCYTHSNCPQGYECGGSRGCSKCASGSNLTYGNCNCPSGTVSDGNGNCVGQCSYPYTIRCPEKRACCQGSCYGYSSSCSYY